MVDDREQRMEALRTRVKAKKEAAINGGILEEELVVSASELTTELSAEEQNEADDWYALWDKDADRWRNLAAAFIFIGSVLGMLSGALILQGNPTELLNTSFLLKVRPSTSLAQPLRISRAMA